MTEQSYAGKSAKDQNGAELLNAVFNDNRTVGLNAQNPNVMTRKGGEL